MLPFDCTYLYMKVMQQLITTMFIIINIHTDDKPIINDHLLLLFFAVLAQLKSVLTGR